VYGLIFLYKYRDEKEAAKESPKCPQHVWFANQVCGIFIHRFTDGHADERQTINNACATVALLNIVMNVPEINLGETLSAFKAETQNLKPPYRGKKLGSNEFIRAIHNSFVRYGLVISS
jgi:ubiquitin carboxyl-terminal hydrolase L5